jgi:plastocyanin domain-containing protein
MMDEVNPMFNKYRTVGIATLLGFLLSMAMNAAAQMTADSPNHAAFPESFRRIEQPLGLKIGVTAGGLALIGLEVWWFLISKSKSQRANAPTGIQELSISVDGGYEPAHIVVYAGQPVRLNFLRRDPSSCLEKVLFPDFHIAQDLALNKVTAIEFTPEKPGQYSFTCGMNMFRGVIEVQAPASF